MKYSLLPLLTAATLLFAGCASQPDAEEVSGLPPPKVTLTIQESGKSVSLRPGEYAMISLKENASTGYSWFFRLDTGKKGPQPKRGGVAELVAERVIPPAVAMPGAPGAREVMVKAVQPGTIWVVGDCLRPWDRDRQPAQTVRYRIDVVR